VEKLPQVWKMILKHVHLENKAEIFELGCGGGSKMLPLSLRGYKVSGIDCSEDVLKRCQRFIEDVRYIMEVVWI